MKYFVEYKPLGAGPCTILGEAQSVEDANKLIDEHIKQFYFPSDTIRADFRHDRYTVSEVVTDWHEVQKDSHWAVLEATITRDGKHVTICGAPYRKEA